MNMKLIVLVLATVCNGLAAGKAQKSAYELEKVEHIGSFVGSEEAKEHLARHGFVVTDQQFKQIFEAYIGSELPKFITTDSAWHTYHVLLEEGVRKLEEAQARCLKKFSTRLIEVALSKSKGKKGPYMDLARFAGVGLGLQDRDAIGSVQTELRSEVERVLEKLQGATGLIDVLFFGLPIMPERLRAHSFYTRSPALSGYFAARQWYAISDFRANSEAETARALRLSLMIEGDRELSDLYAQLSLPYDALLAHCEDGDVLAYSRIADRVFGKDFSESNLTMKLDEFRLALSELPNPSVNDQCLWPEQYENFAEETKGFRLLPPRRIPSAVLFQNTIDPIVKDRMFPSGVDLLAAGPLASEAGKRVLRASVRDDKVADAILKANAGPLPDSLHGRALELLALLQEPLPATAPAPLRTAAWHDKQLWTQLGAWAEQRHTWALHTKLSAHYLCASPEDIGMVSPYPEFFDGLADLSRATAEELAKFIGEDVIDTRAAGQELLDLITFISRWSDMTRQPTEEESRKFQEFMEFSDAYFAKVAPETHSGFELAIKKLEQSARRCAEARQPTQEDLDILRVFAEPHGEIRDLLRDFAKLCHALADIADKQLTRQALDEKDKDLIRNYGKTLARFHFYSGNSWLDARDDFPRVTPIFASPREGEILYAGLARPETLYVIVETGDKQVLHWGAVLSYREFRRALAKPLSDENWQAEVKRGAISPAPSFTDSFRKSTAVAVEEIVTIIKSGGTYADVDNVTDRRITHVMIEQLLGGKPKDAGWLRLCLCRRARAEDVGDLIRILKQTHLEDIDHLVMCISNLPWAEHRDELLELLKHAQVKYADSAAYIMSQRPEDIDVEALVGQFDKLPVRTRRLIVFLFGQIESPCDEVESTLIKALNDKDPGLRYEAAKTVARTRLKKPSMVDALISRLDDPNEYVCAGAAMALRKLGVKNAAPAMLARLNKRVRPRNITTNESFKQREAVLERLQYGGCAAIMVLHEDDFLLPREGEARALGAELIMGLGTFGYAPAKEQLEKMLRGNYGSEALDALERIDPVGHLDRLITVANDRNADTSVRKSALKALSRIGKPELALKLVPILDDTSKVGFAVGDEEWRICDYAAKAIALMLDWPDNISEWSDEGSDRESKERLITRIRKWAQEQN